MTILVVHGYSSFPLRSTIRDLLFSFKKYSKHDVFYLNLYHEFTVPGYIKRIEFDLIIFHTLFLCSRWWGDKDFFQKNIIDKCSWTSQKKGIKIIMPQDEWIHTNLLSDFINSLNIDVVFSVAPSSEWRKIYEGIDFDKVKFYQILTGYIDENVLMKVNNLKKTTISKDIDIGYRAFKSPPWLGRHGFLKTKIAEIFKEKAPANGFCIDISTEGKDTIMGDDWYKFLLRCKFFIGVEGGSTVLDTDGSIWANGLAYQAINPTASFEDFEKNCFPGMDGTLGLICLSPRHLEACLTDTCQVLIEGEYNNILKSGEHFIEVKRDFSNLESVFNDMKDADKVEKIVSNAKRDIVESGLYTYRSMVKFIIEHSISNRNYEKSLYSTVLINFYLLLNSIDEKFKWKRYQFYLQPIKIKNIYKYKIKPRVDKYLFKIN